MRIATISLGLTLLAACSKSTAGTASTAPEAPTGSSLSAAQCEAQGGKVVGDIGDGAIHRPDYRCPDSGEAPLGSITADPGGPMATEGSVCCK